MIHALITILSGSAIGGLVSYFGLRRVRRAQAAAYTATATAQIAGAVEDIVAPLRAEIKILRAQVAILTKELKKNGLAVPDLSKAD